MISCTRTVHQIDLLSNFKHLTKLLSHIAIKIIYYPFWVFIGPISSCFPTNHDWLAHDVLQKCWTWWFKIQTFVLLFGREIRISIISLALHPQHNLWYFSYSARKWTFAHTNRTSASLWYSLERVAFFGIITTTALLTALVPYSDASVTSTAVSYSSSSCAARRRDIICVTETFDRTRIWGFFKFTKAKLFVRGCTCVTYGTSCTVFQILTQLKLRRIYIRMKITLYK